MPAFRLPNAADRLTAAANARKAMLEKFQARPAPDDPQVAERQQAMKAVAEAREKRFAERKAAREAEAARVAAEQAALKARQAAEAEERETMVARKAAEAKARALALAAEQKAARDARYARRKGRA